MNKKYCIICGKELQGNQRKYCSNNCKQKGHYQDIKDNPNTTFSQKVRGLRRKVKLVELMGGKCEICGYNKNIAALEFHHKDSYKKTTSLDMRKLANMSWQKIIDESKNCMLLCANCHREVHNPESTIENINKLKTIGEYHSLNNKEVKHSKNCPICNSEIPLTDHRIYCSKECKEEALKRRKHRPSFEEINEKYKELYSWQKVADFYGITRKMTQTIRNKYYREVSAQSYKL